MLIGKGNTTGLTLAELTAVKIKFLYFVMTCVATLTCVIRADYNFAFGLLGFFLIKSTNPNKYERAANTVSYLFLRTHKCILLG